MKKSNFLTTLFLSTILITGIIGNTGSMASDGHQHHSGHQMTTMKQSAKIPTEPGQSAFAAIAEIVEILEADPKTDWSKVNINALRDHLVDMEKLTMEAKVTQSVEGDKIVFTVSGTPGAIEAAKRMVPAHAAIMSTKAGWAIEGSVSGDTVKMIVSPTPQTSAQKIKALGFFGIMASGVHHQVHHMGMATGAMVH